MNTKKMYEKWKNTKLTEDATNKWIVYGKNKQKIIETKKYKKKIKLV